MIHMDFDKDILLQIKHHPEVVDLILKLTHQQLGSLTQFVMWSPRLLTLLRDDIEHASCIHKIWDSIIDKQLFMESYVSAVSAETFDRRDMMDAFSLGQINSKMWLVRTLVDLGVSLGRTWTLCGWIGVLPYLLLERRQLLHIDNIRSFDIDHRCARPADCFNKQHVANGWTFKASTLDVNTLSYDDHPYLTKRADGSEVQLMDTADTVINTSTDHLDGDAWFHAIPRGRLVVLQNNDFREVDQHVNNMPNLTTMIDRYPLDRRLYDGQLDCGDYQRFMIIGYK